MASSRASPRGNSWALCSAGQQHGKSHTDDNNEADTGNREASPYRHPVSSSMASFRILDQPPLSLLVASRDILVHSVCSFIAGKSRCGGRAGCKSTGSHCLELAHRAVSGTGRFGNIIVKERPAVYAAHYQEQYDYHQSGQVQFLP